MRHSLALSATFESDGLGKIKIGKAKTQRNRHEGENSQSTPIGSFGKEPCVSEIVGL
jgi:hypothetical protein